MIVNPILYQQGTKLPELENPGSAADLLAGKQLVDQYGKALTGTMPQRSAGDLTASGAEIIVPAGYYPSQVSKSVAAVTHPKPTLSRSGGTVTASHVQSAGYTTGGTTTEQLTIPTQAGKTVTPKTYAQTAVASGVLTTGAVNVAGDANLVAGNIKSGVSIFGVAGTLSSGGTIYYAGTITGTGVDSYEAIFSVSNLSFTPKGILLCAADNAVQSGQHSTMFVFALNSGDIIRGIAYLSEGNPQTNINSRATAAFGNNNVSVQLGMAGIGFPNNRANAYVFG